MCRNLVVGDISLVASSPPYGENVTRRISGPTCTSRRPRWEDEYPCASPMKPEKTPRRPFWSDVHLADHRRWSWGKPLGRAFANPIKDRDRCTLSAASNFDTQARENDLYMLGRDNEIATRLSAKSISLPFILLLWRIRKTSSSKLHQFQSPPIPGCVLRSFRLHFDRSYAAFFGIKKDQRDWFT